MALFKRKSMDERIRQLKGEVSSLETRSAQMKEINSLKRSRKTLKRSLSPFRRADSTVAAVRKAYNSQATARRPVRRGRNLLGHGDMGLSGVEYFQKRKKKKVRKRYYVEERRQRAFNPLDLI